MPLETVDLILNGIRVLRPVTTHDARGWFRETYRADQFHAWGLPAIMRQENHSASHRGVIRGLHFQWDPPMAKLMRVVRGSAFLVAVDIRLHSPSLGKWHGLMASQENALHVYAPAGFARGFCVLSDCAEVQYLCSGLYNPETESGIRWNDPDLGITWPVPLAGPSPILSAKDAQAQTLREWLARPEAQKLSA